MNTITVDGNITRCELRYTPAGAATWNFGIAHNRRWFSKTKDAWEEETSFFDCVVWRELAENAAESLIVGSRVVVTGRLEQQRWEKDGEKKSKIQIVVDEVAPSLRFATAQIVKTERTNNVSNREPDPVGSEPF